MLLVAPHDDIYEQTKRAIPLLSDNAEVLDLPHMTKVMEILSTHVEESAGYLRNFFA